MNDSAQPIDTYLLSVPASHREALQRVRKVILNAYPSAEECMCYQMPAFRLNGKVLVAFRSAKAHCSVHPMSEAVIASLAEELSDFKTSKGTIRFTPEGPIPDRLLIAVLNARAAECMTKTTKRKK
jgi:uncharacterized protein YdhG (YjbR/CyaY superfamily)